jgi:hypothetical protein
MVWTAAIYCRGCGDCWDNFGRSDLCQAVFPAGRAPGRQKLVHFTVSSALVVQCDLYVLAWVIINCSNMTTATLQLVNSTRINSNPAIIPSHTTAYTPAASVCVLYRPCCWM